MSEMNIPQPLESLDARRHTNAIEELCDRTWGAEQRVMSLLGNPRSEKDTQELARVLDDVRFVRHWIEGAAGGGRRRDRRTHELLSALMKPVVGPPVDVVVHDISLGGALIESDGVIQESGDVLLVIPSLRHAVRAQIVGTIDGLTRVAFTAVETSCAMDFIKHLERRATGY